MSPIVSTLFLLLVLETQAPSPEPPEVETFDLPPLKVLLVREPPRLSFHLAGKLLVAQRPSRERGSMEFLLDSGWRAARAIRSLRELPEPGGGEPSGGAKGLVIDLVLEGGGEARLRIERGGDGDLRLEVSGPAGTLAARDSLLRYHGERLLGVEGVRWDDPDAPPGPEDDLLAAFAGPLFYISSRGYGAILDLAAAGKRSRIHAPDPDTIRLEMPGGRLVYRLLAGGDPRRTVEMRSRILRRSGAVAGGNPIPRFGPPVLFWLARPAPRDLERDLEALVRLGVVPAAPLFRGEKGGMAPLLAERFPLSPRVAATWSVAPAPGLVLDRELPATFEGLRRAVREALLLAVIGAPEFAFRFGSNRPAPPGFFTRSAEVSAFLPIQMIEAGRTVPGGEVEKVLKRSVRLRREAAAALAGGAGEQELPPIRPLFLAEPTDPSSWPAADEWLIGDTLLVAPVLEEGAVRRQVRFPSGEWEDAWAEPGKARSLNGPVTLEVDAPLGDVPVFRKKQ